MILICNQYYYVRATHIHSSFTSHLACQSKCYTNPSIHGWYS